MIPGREVAGSEAAAVTAVHRSGEHTFSKRTVAAIELVEGHGVRGDAHAGRTVQHRSRVARDPSQPNLRQVHLIGSELLATLAAAGVELAPGALGENITTSGIDLLAVPVGTRLRIGEDGAPAGAVITVTGLRNPCRQIEDHRSGLLGLVVRRAADGSVRRLAGVMGVVSRGGFVRPGDVIEVEPPPRPHHPLAPV